MWTDLVLYGHRRLRSSMPCRGLLVVAGLVVLACAGSPQREAAARANRLLEEGHTEEALAAYRESRRAWPGAAIFPHGEGVALYLLGRHEEAEDPLREAIRLAPGEGLYHLYLGHALSELRRYDEAVTAYEAMTRLEPLEARGWKALGYVHYNRRHYPEARAALQKYLAFARDAEDYESVWHLVQSLPAVPAPGP